MSLPVADTCRWFARILACGSVVLVIAFAVGEHASPMSMSARELVLSGFLLAALAANLAAWRWELAGAAVALTSTVGFAGLELVRNGRLPGPWIFGVMAVPALFHGCSWLRRRRHFGAPGA
jgi:hypothetical protein